ncbi:MAG: universal stress protein [Gammaproteobacteria bacterium]
MTFRLRRILVAIRDERHTSRTQLRKAAALARASGARVELFHAINEPQALDSLRRGSVAGEPVREIVGRLASQSEKRLARLTALKDFRGLKVTCSASWDFPPHEAIIRRALATKADLVVACTQHKGVAARLLLANTDWELIRHCPCPVLVVKTSRAWNKPAVIAAIDPFHAHDKPAALDRRILEAGRYLVRELQGCLHAFHAYMPMVLVAPAPAGHALAINASPELEEIHTEQVTKAFERVVTRFGVAPRRQHLHMGIVHDELAAAIRDVDGRIVVLGAVSRSAIRRFLIGSTAERMLDRLECDFLIVKPPSFRSRVPRRASLAWLEG